VEKAVVFGCGKTAHDYREEIHKCFEVIAYTCNRPEKWGQEMDGVPIICKRRYHILSLRRSF